MSYSEENLRFILKRIDDLPSDGRETLRSGGNLNGSLRQAEETGTDNFGDLPPATDDDSDPEEG